MSDFPKSNREWLAEKRSEQIAELLCVERRVAGLAKLLQWEITGDADLATQVELIKQGLSSHSPRFFALMRQGQGAWRQLARIEELMNFDPTGGGFASWRAQQIERLAPALAIIPNNGSNEDAA